MEYKVLFNWVHDLETYLIICCTVLDAILSRLPYT